jgi:hypothetical protein
MSRAADLTSTEISTYRDSFHPAPTGTTPLADILDAIRGRRYGAHVAWLRQILAHEGKRAYDRAKASLPAVTFGGIFSPTRGNVHLQQHSGIVHVDLDKLRDLVATRRAYSNDPRTVYLFTSPSATGLKAGIHVERVSDDAAYKHAWHAARAEFERLYHASWDPTGKDVSRLCYVSSDPDLYVNPEAACFDVAPPPTPPPKPATPIGMAITHTLERSDDYALRAIKTATRMIQMAEPGTRHHTRLRAARLLGGYIAGGMLSHDQAYAILKEALRDHTTHLERALATVEDGLRYGQANPIILADLEAERRAWLEQRSSRHPCRAKPTRTDPWDGVNTLPLRPYTGWRGLIRGRARSHG